MFILPCEAEDEDFEQVLPLKNAPSGAFGFLVFAVAQVPDAVAEAFAAPFEFGLRPPVGARRVAVRTAEVLPFVVAGEDVPHPFGVFRPVGRAVDLAARAQFAPDEVGEGFLYDAAFVVPRFRPGIGEVDLYARKRPVGDVVAQDGDGVVADEAQVVEACGRGGEQRMADAGAVDFDADIARVRRGLCHLYEAFAVAKADFEVEVAVVAK